LAKNLFISLLKQKAALRIKFASIRGLLGIVASYFGMVKLCAISSIKIRLPRLFYDFAFQIEVDQSRFEDLNQVQAFLFLLRILSLSCMAALADHFKRFLLI
jgi:hypothetical protein